MKKIFFKYYKKHIAGGYIPSDIRGAKGEDIPDSFQVKIPAWILELEKAPNPSKEAERILIEKYQDPLIYEAFEEDESLYKEYTSLVSKIRNEWEDKVFELFPVQVDREEDVEGIWLPEGVRVPSGIYIYNEAVVMYDNEAQRIWEEKEKQKEEKRNKLMALFNEAVNLFTELVFIRIYEDEEKILVTYKGYELHLFLHDSISNIKTKIKTIENRIKEKKEIEERIKQQELEKEKRTQERIKTGEIAYADNVHLFLEGNILKAPSWAVPHLIGRGGRQIQRIQEILGKKIRIESYPEQQPSNKSKAGWLI